MFDCEDFVVEKLKEIEIKGLLRKLEWSGITHGQGMNMGDIGPVVSCCPICGGINPKSPFTNHFNEKSIGHKKSCKLEKARRKVAEWV